MVSVSDVCQMYKYCLHGPDCFAYGILCDAMTLEYMKAIKSCVYVWWSFVMNQN